MKALALILIAGTAFAGTASIVSSFKSPPQPPQGIDYYGGYVYIAAPPGAIYKTTTTGSIALTIRANPVGPGLDRTNTNFWTTGGRAIFKLSTTGSWVGTIPIPTDGRGVAFGGGFLWLSGNNNYIYKILPGGSIVTTFRVGYVNPGGICYYNEQLWIADTNGPIAHATTTGSLIESYTGSISPYGITCEGQYVWYSDLKSGWVYKMLPIPYGTPVAPASLGQIKTLYR